MSGPGQRWPAPASDNLGTRAKIAVVDIQGEAAQEVASGIAAAGGEAIALAVDISDAEATKAMARQTAEAFGGIDILVNNAAIYAGYIHYGLMDLPLDYWQKFLDVNLTGVFLCGREAAERMIRLGHGGVIINISSISKCGNAGQTNYSAAKAGVTAMAVVWAKELARYGIRAASIAPGFTRTALLAGNLGVGLLNAGVVGHAVGAPHTRSDAARLVAADREGRGNLRPAGLVGGRNARVLRVDLRLPCLISIGDC